MSTEQGYHLNVSKIIPENVGKRFGPYHNHYCSIFLGYPLPDIAAELAAEIAARFPTTEFKCELMLWELRGYTKDF